MSDGQDKEIRQYRDLMAVPDHFESGFGLKTIVGALFLGFLMVPGSIYLSLYIGGAGLSVAARWVTVILFAEVAKRSMSTLRRQEIFVLFYMTGIALGGHLHGGVMTSLLWNQALVQSDTLASFGIEVPPWVAASAESIKAEGRTFLTRQWMVPVFFLAGMFILQRIDAFGLGYALYRLTSHVEKLPFPMAPVGAMGITALVEEKDGSQQWRWRCFSAGGVLGLVFGGLYFALPTISGAYLDTAITIIPVPWLDLTENLSTKDNLPATPLNLVFDLQFLLVGMVLPFWAVVGGFIGLIITLIFNPVLYRMGVLTSWQPGMDLVRTLYSNHVDFYLSFGIGLAAAILVMSLLPIVRSLYRQATARSDEKGRRTIAAALRDLITVNRQRGDLSIFVAIGIYLFSTLVYIGICVLLMPGTPQLNYQDRFPWLYFLAFAFLYTPIMSYVNAKLEGMVGQTIQIPMVREAAFIFSGYKGSEIWFAPIPINDYGSATRQFREMELVGTRVSSLIKTELIVIPVVIVCSLVFSEFIWRVSEIPSEKFPFAQKYWELLILNFGLTATATAEGSSPFMEAIKFDVIGWGLGAGLVAFAVLSFLSLPTFLVYGAVRGLGQTTPGNVLAEMIGALLGRIYLQRRFGHRLYKTYMMVFVAGYGAGVGLVAMLAVALALIAASTGGKGF